MTASAFKEQRQKLLDAGMDDFVRKPYRIHEIYDCLARHLGAEIPLSSSAPEAGKRSPVAVTPAMLAVLPAAAARNSGMPWQTSTANASAAAIQQIGEADVDLGRMLARLAENFDYPAIMNALEPGTH